MTTNRTFDDRAGREVTTPGEAVDALLGDRNRLPDPAVTVGAAHALRTLARRLAEETHRPYAVYSPAQAHQVLESLESTIDSLAVTLEGIDASIQQMSDREEITSPIQCGRTILRSDLTLAGLALRRLNGRLRIRGTIRSAVNLCEDLDYTGYTDQGRAHQLAAITAGLVASGATIDDTQEPGPGENGTIEFTRHGRRYALIDDETVFGWELYACDSDRFQRITAMPEARTPGVHPTVIVSAALAAIDSHAAATGPATTITEER